VYYFTQELVRIVCKKVGSSVLQKDKLLQCQTML